MKRIVQPLKSILSNGDRATPPSWEKAITATPEEIAVSLEEEKAMHPVINKKAFYNDNDYLHIIPWETFMALDMSRFLTDGKDGYMIFETDETDPLRGRGASIFLSLERI